MSDTVIKVENISKQYRLGTVGTGSLAHDLNRTWHRVRGKEDPYLKIGETNDRAVKGSSEYVWALQDINFEVKQGEVLGIIGRNGAGKSTLLKILSRTTTPTTGQIKIKGRVASLLEVGTGFHPELSGRENIFLNGAILGMTRHEIKSKFDEIVDFAGVERYIDTPVKRYSSGMYVRLAFGVAAHLEPEILIVDEVLAVGDAEFQKKALGKMKDVSEKDGRTVLFVSHNLAAMANLCDRGILVRHGQLVEDNDISSVLKTYNSIGGFGNYLVNYNTDKNTIQPFISTAKLIVNKTGEDPGIFMSNEIITIELNLENIDFQKNIAVTIVLRNSEGKWLIHSTDEFSENVSAKSQFRKCVIPANLLYSDNYFVTLAIGSRLGELYEKLEDVLSFSIVYNGKLRERNIALKGILSPEVLSWES